jgi:hypothetical protein
VQSFQSRFEIQLGSSYWNESPHQLEDDGKIVEAPLLEASNQFRNGVCVVPGVSPACYSSQKLLRDGHVPAELCPLVDESFQEVRAGEIKDVFETEPCTRLSLLCVASMPDLSDSVYQVPGEI